LRKEANALSVENQLCMASNMTDWTLPALILLLGYLLGSIPFGVILTRAFGAGDLRMIGSGNIGATNVLRTGRKGLAAATLLLDMAKGAAAVCIARMISPELALYGGVGAFLGHLYPVWLKFRGGKGVATMLGVVLALSWGLGMVYVIVWLAALAATRTSSVSGMAAALSAPVAAAAIGRIELGFVLLALAMLVLWKHKDNIGRLIEGTEPKIGQETN
jgi:acyl phosphate:glycerol-3-phosphate acyltransferase